MSRLRTCVLVAVCFFSPAGLFADLLELTDGTVHRGKVVASSPQKVGFKTEDGKMLTIDRGDIKSLTKDAAPPPSQPQKPQPKAEIPPEPAAGVLDTKTVSFDFVATPLPDVVGFLEKAMGVHVRIECPKDAMPAGVTLCVKDMSARSALWWIAYLSGLECVMRGDIAVLLSPGQMRQAKLSPIGTSERVEEDCVRIEKAIEGRSVTFDFVETPLRDALQFVGSLGRMPLVRGVGGLPTLRGALQFVGSRASVPMLADPKIADKNTGITLRVRDMRLNSALWHITWQAGLDYLVLQSAVLVTTPEGKRALAEKYRPDLLADKVPELEGDPKAKGAAAASPLTEAMAKKISFDFVEAPLPDVLQFVASLTDVTIVMDPSVAREGREVTLRVKDMRSEAALDWVLKLVGLTKIMKHDAIVVTTRERAFAMEQRSLREYDIRELLKEAKGGPFENTGAAWADYFARVIAPGTWGRDKGASIEYRAGKLLVLHNQEVQNQVERLVRNWCEGARKEREKPGSNETPMPPLDEEGPLKGKRVTFEFVEATIKQVCEEFAKQSGVPFVPDVGNLGKAAPKAITLRGTRMGLKAALDAICQQADLGYLFRDEAVLVTTRQEARERDSPVWRTHYLGAALRRHPELTGQRVVEKIQQDIAPGTWGVAIARGGHPPSINQVNSAYIVVIHTPAVQRQIRAWLAMLAEEPPRGK